MNNYKSIFLFCVVLFFIALDIHAQTPFVVNQNTPIEFSDKNVLVYKDETNQATVHEVLEKLDEFVPAQKINGFQSSVTYWMYQKMVNKLETDREFRVGNA